MLRFPNFNMLFQLVLTKFFTSELFSCLLKVDYVITVKQRAYCPKFLIARKGVTGPLGHGSQIQISFLAQVLSDSDEYFPSDHDYSLTLKFLSRFYSFFAVVRLLTFHTGVIQEDEFNLVRCEGRFNSQYRRARNTISFLNFIFFFSWYDSENTKFAIRTEHSWPNQKVSCFRPVRVEGIEKVFLVFRIQSSCLESPTSLICESFSALMAWVILRQRHRHTTFTFNLYTSK